MIGKSIIGQVVPWICGRASWGACGPGILAVTQPGISGSARVAPSSFSSGRTEQGRLSRPTGGRPRGSGKLATHQAFLIGRVEAQPDITMPELARALQVERDVIASPASLSRVLCHAGFTWSASGAGK